MEYNHDTSHLFRTGHDDVSHTRMTTWLSYFLSYFPLMVSDAILCTLRNLKTLWNIIMILHSYLDKVIMMCHVQEWQLSFLFFLRYLTLMVEATMPSILNTIRNIFMRLYGSVEEVVTVCLVYEIRRLLYSYPPLPFPPPPPPPPPHTHTHKKNFFFPGFEFFVKIHLLESSKLDL